MRRFTRAERPAWMSCGDWLAQRGWEDSPSGWSRYVGYLTELAGSEAEQKRRGLEGLSTGWAIGTQGWKRAIAKDHAQRALSPGVEAGELRELKSAHWTHVLDAELLRLGKSREDAVGDNCGAAWKIEVAGRLRQAGAPYAWITTELHMGKASSVRSYLSQVKNSI